MLGCQQPGPALHMLHLKPLLLDLSVLLVDKATKRIIIEPLHGLITSLAILIIN